MQTFTVTEEHLKLLREANVGWDNAEFGAPCIDPKRPYGNGDVYGDMHRILTGKRLKEDEEIDEKLAKRYETLHVETGIALQIALATGRFATGDYVCSDYDSDWRERP